MIENNHSVLARASLAEMAMTGSFLFGSFKYVSKGAQTSEVTKSKRRNVRRFAFTESFTNR